MNTPTHTDGKTYVLSLSGGRDSAGASRVGCLPCIFAKKGELAGLPDVRVDIIRDFEAAVSAVAARREARPTAMFQAPIRTVVWRGLWECSRRDEYGDGAGCDSGLLKDYAATEPVCAECGAPLTKRMSRSGEVWPIDRIIKWARKPLKRGHRYVEEPDAESGCMRWGQCEQITLFIEEPADKAKETL